MLRGDGGSSGTLQIPSAASAVRSVLCSPLSAFLLPLSCFCCFLRGLHVARGIWMCCQLVSQPLSAGLESGNPPA